jgi:trypsin
VAPQNLVERDPQFRARKTRATSRQCLRRRLNTSPHTSFGERTRFGSSAYSPGAKGTGRTSPLFLGRPEVVQSDEPVPEGFGTSNHPFTTARADLFTENTNTAYPHRAAGKLFFNEPGGSFICSASLIKRGVVVTAAHCVANYGKKLFYSAWQFVPRYGIGSAPFGIWTVKRGGSFELLLQWHGWLRRIGNRLCR